MKEKRQGSWVYEQNVKKKIKRLEEQAKMDALTGLYHNQAGKELIGEYLRQKSPYSSCGLMIVDIDYFKNVNDSYGHLFGDEVLQKFAGFLSNFFEGKDILVRAGGDEFVILVKEISHNALVKKVMQLVKSVRELHFSKKSYVISCSVGVCFLSENISGYTYEQVFKNADWALYQAKMKGRGRYVFCDNLKRYEVMSEERTKQIDLEGYYLRNDVIASAFEIFDKMNSFDTAIELLMKIIGIQFQLDRITVIHTNIKDKTTNRMYQWCSERAPKALVQEASYTKEDFKILFRSYNEYGVAVLQHDEMEEYSEPARKLLMQGEARTVVYAAMYCEGKYTGAISYVTCGEKRKWSLNEQRKFGELTKIISAHLVKGLALNGLNQGMVSAPDYDSLTGLLSFVRFKEEVEHMIVGEFGQNNILLYTDFRGFKYFNQKYGYAAGDQLLKEYSNYIMEMTRETSESYLTRIISDQFAQFLSFEGTDEELKEKIEAMNQKFVWDMERRFPQSKMLIRTGVYRIAPGCMGVSEALDAANYARKQIRSNQGDCVVIYDEPLRQQQKLENEIINGIDDALRKKEFQVYYQPKIWLSDGHIVGAEALVRWVKEDGTVLRPDFFIPLYEKNGRILDLDFYVFEEVTAFLHKCQQEGIYMVPISVNVSALHSVDETTTQRYLDILKKYDVSPEMLEMELTETATVLQYDKINTLFASLKAAGFITSLDDFGAGYSILNLIMDMPLNVVKLDRVFIDKCDRTEKGIHFLKQLVVMLKNLGFYVLCEGVEKEEQVQILKKIGCDGAQGNWYSTPVSETEFVHLMKQATSTGNGQMCVYKKQKVKKGLAKS